MARVRPLKVAARDAWLLTAAAIDADRIAEAQVQAGRAMQICGWDRYRLAGVILQLTVCSHDLLPRGWGFHQADGPHRHQLLVHPDTARMVVRAHWRSVVAQLRARGEGLVRVDEILGELLIAAMTAPDTLADL